MNKEQLVQYVLNDNNRTLATKLQMKFMDIKGDIDIYINDNFHFNTDVINIYFNNNVYAKNLQKIKDKINNNVFVVETIDQILEYEKYPFIPEQTVTVDISLLAELFESNNHAEELRNLSNQRNKILEQMAKLSEKENEIKEDMKALLKDNYEKIDICTDKISALTKPIYLYICGQGNQEYLFDLGRYSIETYYKNDDVIIKQYDDKQPHRNHPHSPSGNSWCFGNMTGQIQKLAQDFKVYQLFSLLYRYVAHANINDTYGRTVFMWKSLSWKEIVELKLEASFHQQRDMYFKQRLNKSAPKEINLYYSKTHGEQGQNSHFLKDKDVNKTIQEKVA